MGFSNCKMREILCQLVPSTCFHKIQSLAVGSFCYKLRQAQKCSLCLSFTRSEYYCFLGTYHCTYKFNLPSIMQAPIISSAVSPWSNPTESPFSFFRDCPVLTSVYITCLHYLFILGLSFLSLFFLLFLCVKLLQQLHTSHQILFILPRIFSITVPNPFQ